MLLEPTSRRQHLAVLLPLTILVITFCGYVFTVGLDTVWLPYFPVRCKECQAKKLAWPRPPSPNPYQQPGYYAADAIHPTRNRWVPLDPSIAPSPDLAEKMMRGPEVAGEELAWVKNRTVLLLGDSISRKHTESFCHWMGSQMRAISVDDPLYSQFAFQKERDATPHLIYDKKMLGRPWLCEIPQWNFTILYMWLISQEDSAEKDGDDWSTGGFWAARTRHYTPPSLPEDRIRAVVAPILRNLERTPDLIEFSTSAWDLDWLKIRDHDDKKTELLSSGLNATEAETKAGEAATTPLPFDWLQWWRGKTIDTWRVIWETFGPNVHIQYRILHQMDQSWTYPRLFVHSRTAQLNNAARSIPGLPIDPWADHIRGQEMTTDWIHPGPAPNWLWVDMMLFQLWEVVTAAEEGYMPPEPPRPGAAA